jgi:hypothetical protein
MPVKELIGTKLDDKEYSKIVKLSEKYRISKSKVIRNIIEDYFRIEEIIKKE